jgi:outer membrane protein OmpA-like peptidoglycan-associated protein
VHVESLRRAQVRRAGTGAALAFLMIGTACATMGRREQGAAMGAAGGAVLGGVVGTSTGSTARGAIIGAVVGGAAGAIIGHQMDQQAKELEVAIPGATVERVGEGIAVTFTSGLLYAFDSDVIRPDAGANLEQLAKSLVEYPNTSLLIFGHTDTVGTAAYNQALSERRATAAMRYLTQFGVAPSRVRTAGRGEAEPVFSNDTEAGRERNRRIEVAIFKSPSS